MSTRSTPGTRLLAGLVATMMPPDAGGPDPDATARQLGLFLTRLPRLQRSSLLAAAAAVDGVAFATGRRRLAAATPDQREAVLARISAAGGSDLLDALKASVALVAGADTHKEDMWARATAEPPARPDADLDVWPAATWPSRTRCDVVVIGSGAGGAMAARELARAGLDVIVVEEGRRFSVDEFRTRHPADRFGELYRDGGATIALGRPPVILPIGRGVGGTTLVNSGTCYRPPAAVVRRWSSGFGLEVADPDRLVPLLDDVEATLQVGPVPLDIMGRNGRTMIAGAQALGWRTGPLQRNAPGCDGCCQCAIGCPRNAKFGVHLNALPQACAAGARIVSELRVRRILHEAGRATGVAAVRQDGSAVEVLADRVVVATGATETPPLLRRSGLGRHPQLGRNLALHPALSTAGRFDEPITAWRGVLQSATIEEFHQSHRVLIEATATPPGMGTMTLPGYGRRFMEEVAAADRLVTLGAMVGDRGSGRVMGRWRHGTLMTYFIHGDDARRLLDSIGFMGRALFAAGASEVLTGIPGRETARSVDDLDAAVGSADIRRMHLAAFHPTGTARAGADEQAFPVDPWGRLRGIRGVWVADASVIPSCPEVNPQVTIMAMAQSIAHALVAGSA